MLSKSRLGLIAALALALVTGLCGTGWSLLVSNPPVSKISGMCSPTDRDQAHTISQMACGTLANKASQV